MFWLRMKWNSGVVLGSNKEHAAWQRRITYLLFFFLLIYAGCAKNIIKNVSDEEVLKERVQIFWNHRVKEELDKAYAYEYPLYKKKVSLVKYIQHNSGSLMRYNSFEIRDIAIEEEAAKVRVKVGVKVKVPGARTFDHETELTGTWVKVNGEWYHVPGTKKRSTQ